MAGTSSARTLFAKLSTKAGLATTLMLVMLASGCASGGGSATEGAICRELAMDWVVPSARDTDETLDQQVRLDGTFQAACPGVTLPGA